MFEASEKEALARIVERIRAIGPLPHPDDDDTEVLVRPPATKDERAALEAIWGGSLPGELAAFLDVTAGFEHPSLDWAPHPEEMGIDALDGLLRASNIGNGDGFAIERNGERCRVWWLGHDSHFIVYWAESIADFLSLWIERTERILSDPTQDPFTVWDPTDEASPVDSSADVADDDLRSFLAELPKGALSYDLRSARGTELPDDCMRRLGAGGTMRRRGLLFAFTARPAPVPIPPMPLDAYPEAELSPAERAVLRALPRGTLVLHQRDLPPGGYFDTSDHPGRDSGYRPPFHVVFPKRPWWRVW